MSVLKQMMIATAIATSASSVAAFAKDAPVAAPEAPAPKQSDKTRYCVKSEVTTGTILPRRTCKTLAEWKRIGIDPTKPQD